MKKKAFTLVEVMIVVVIIGLLASLVIPAIQKMREKENTATIEYTGIKHIIPMQTHVNEDNEVVIDADKTFVLSVKLNGKMQEVRCSESAYNNIPAKCQVEIKYLTIGEGGEVTDAVLCE